MCRTFVVVRQVFDEKCFPSTRCAFDENNLELLVVMMSKIFCYSLVRKALFISSWKLCWKQGLVSITNSSVI